MRVVEGGQQPGLADEASSYGGVDGQLRREHLDGDVALQVAVRPGEHDAPATPAEHLADLVARQDRTSGLDDRVGHGISSPMLRRLVPAAASREHTGRAQYSAVIMADFWVLVDQTGD